MRRKLLSLVLVLSISFAFAQEDTITRRVPVPHYPPLKGVMEDDTIKSNAGGSESTLSGFVPYSNPTAPPEVARANALGNIPVNLYTGSPVINLPIYTVTEGRLNLPLFMNYAHSTVKPTAVAGWTGLGFELAGVPSLTRLIRGFPDEGYLEYNNSGFSAQKGYYFYGSAIVTADKKQDKEPDYFFVSTPSGSGKFIFDRYRQAHFFPVADIKVEVTYTSVADGGGIARKFSQFKITFPDGITYYFSGGTTEESSEVEIKDAQTFGIYPYPFNPDPAPFQNFIKQGMIPSGWACTRIESPYGEKIDLNYQRVAYTFYRLADNDATNLCPLGTTTKINKVYVRSSLLSSIKTSAIELNFNTGYQTCTYDDITNTTTCSNLGVIPRLDIDSWGNAPTNSSTSGKLLKSITVKDLGSTSSTDQITYNFDYEYFDTPTEVSYPGYTSSEVGITHKKKLKLKHINYPGGDRHTFHYENESVGNLHSRFTYGLDHWGYRNSYQPITTIYGYIGTDELSSCGTDKTPDFTYARDLVLANISHNSGSEVYFEYELNLAKNYTGNVGGLRIKSIISKDNVREQSIRKNYTYTLADNSSSGFLFIKPIYRINYFGADNQNHALSNLYDYLIAEGGRPTVGYSRVTETTTTLADGNFTGKLISYFDQDETEGSIKTNPSCTSGCLFNPMYFNLRQPDLRGGQLLKNEAYNQNNQLIQKTENAYTQSGGITTGSTYCVQRHPKSRADWDYYLTFKKYRLQSQTSTTYSPNGSGLGVASTVSYTYKDQMPETYQTKYKGQHNMPVLITSSDEDGNTLESRILYTADFSFDADTLYGCYEDMYCPGNYSCPLETCSYSEIITHVPPYGSEARGIFAANQRYIFMPIESRQLVNNQTVSSTYTALVSTATADISLPKSTYNLRKIPKAGFGEVYYRKTDNTMVRDSDYGAQPDAQILSYNSRGFVVDSKVNKGSTNRTTYLTPVIPSGSTSNYGKVDALSQSRTIAKPYLGVDKVVSPNQLERKVVYDNSTGRTLRELDKDNNIVKQYDYHPIPTAAGSSISWNEDSYAKFCVLGNASVYLYVNGVSFPTVAQFSADGGLTWHNANSGSSGMVFVLPPTASHEFKARASNNHSNVITTTKDISCEAVVFGWGTNTVSTVSSNVCRYELSLVGLSTGGVGEFSLDNFSTFYTAPWPDIDKAVYTLLKAPQTQQFWARDSNHPSNVITINLNVCQP